MESRCGYWLGYDPENDLTSVSSIMAATYDAGGLRASKTNSDGPVSRETSQGPLFYTFDPQGNIAQRLSAGEGVPSSSFYDAFGMPFLTRMRIQMLAKQVLYCRYIAEMPLCIMGSVRGVLRNNASPSV